MLHANINSAATNEAAPLPNTRRAAPVSRAAPSRAHLQDREVDRGHAQSIYGNQAVLRLLNSRPKGSPPLLQRKCACEGSSENCSACSEKKEGVLHRSAGTQPEPNSIPAIVHEVLRSAGQPLDAGTRAFMEPRFGYDFSDVRIHTDATAAQSARAVNARAYTVGSHIVFAAREFSPNTTDGRSLLAHELAHTAQQQGATLDGSVRIGAVDAPAELEADRLAHEVIKSPARQSVSRATDGGVWLRRWISCTAEACPTRAAGENERAARAPMQAAELVTPVSGFIVWGFPISSSAAPSLATNPVWSAFDSQTSRGLDDWSVRGFSDCEGGVELNTRLREARAHAVNGMLSPGARARVTSVAGAPLSECVSSNDTEANRSYNRAVVFERAQVRFPDESPSPPPRCPPSTTTAVTNLADYIALVRCAESRTGYGPRDMLAMLRQMYYGKSWSFTSTTSNWDNVIPCSPNLGHPEPVLGRNLFQALGNSAEVGGVDMGHIFTGLEAMVCPSSSVNFFLGMATVSTPNEDFATWAGDLGAACAATLVCPTLGSAAASDDNCGNAAGRHSLTFYLGVHAPAQDLEGDIDPFVIRAATLGVPCGRSALRAYVPSRPISEILGEYYYDPSTTLGTGRTSRNHCFLEILGATFDASARVNNRRAIVTGPMRARVLDFARAFYTNIAGIPSTPNPTELRVMEVYAESALDWFITWLETTPPVTP